MSATIPAAATMPDWRMAPPSMRRKCRARSMNAELPQRSEPTGALKDNAMALIDMEEGFNGWWGLLFKEGNENNRFGEQVEQYACLYTSRVSNFLFVSPNRYFRAPHGTMPHWF